MAVYWMSPRALASTSHSAAVWSWPGAEQSSSHTGNPHSGHPGGVMSQYWRHVRNFARVFTIFGEGPNLLNYSSDITAACNSYLPGASCCSSLKQSRHWGRGVLAYGPTTAGDSRKISSPLRMARVATSILPGDINRFNMGVRHARDVRCLKMFGKGNTILWMI